MTQDEVIEMAREADASFETAESMFKFAKLVAAKEREACALIGDGYHDEEANCGDLIRLRGKE